MRSRLALVRNVISDWIIVDRGKLAGGYAIRMMRDRMSAEEREQFGKDFGVVVDD